MSQHWTFYAALRALGTSGWQLTKMLLAQSLSKCLPCFCVGMLEAVLFGTAVKSGRLKPLFADEGDRRREWGEYANLDRISLFPALSKSLGSVSPRSVPAVKHFNLLGDFRITNPATQREELEREIAGLRDEARAWETEIEELVGTSPFRGRVGAGRLRW